MRYKCLEGKTEEVRKRFLRLPSAIYRDGFSVCSRKTEKQILDGKHILSSDFEVTPFVVKDENDKTVCRCMLTCYPDDSQAYCGFFESFDNYDAVKLMLDRVFEKASEKGKTSVAGPLDASFWIRYRFKTNHFDSVYTAEPYNPEYYAGLWERYGFEVMCHYSSNHGHVPDDTDEKCLRRFNRMNGRGYTVRNPDKASFEKDLRLVYRLLVRIYSSFPGFRKISEEQFMTVYSPLRHVLNFEMVHLVFSRDGKLAAFSVNIPDYRDAAHGDTDLRKLLYILKHKKAPSQYVMLYMGVDTEHPGLGGALAEVSKKYLQSHGQEYIGALIMDGKATNNYYSSLHYKKYEYVFMRKTI